MLLLYTCGLTHTHTQCAPHKQNATLTDCWQTDAVRRRRPLTQGWHQACLNFTPSSDPGWLSLPSRDTSCLCYLLQEPKEGRGRPVDLVVTHTGLPPATVGLVKAAFNPLMQGWPLQTRRGSAAQWKVGRRCQECGSGAADTVVLFSFFSFCASCPGSDWLCPSQPIRLSFCLHTRRVSPAISFPSRGTQEEPKPGRQTSH